MKNIILLNGRSLETANPPIGNSSRIFSINRKTKIEEKIKRNVDFWVMLSPTEFVDMIEDIYEFLNREEENRLITSTAAMRTMRHFIAARPLPNPQRIILIDGVEGKMYRDTKASPGQWNSVSVLLFFLAIVEKTTPTFIYGMDGLEKDSRVEVYFGESILSEQRIAGNNLFEDMKFFDGNFWAFMQSQQLPPKIFNMNHDSFYQSLPFATECFDSQPNIGKFFPHHEFSNKELLEKMEDLIDLNPLIAGQNAILEYLTNLKNPLIEGQNAILKRLKKPHWLKRIFKRV